MSDPPRTLEDPDWPLVERWRRANAEREEVSREVYKRYSQRVAGLFRRKGHPADRVQELTQETFHHVFHGLESYRREVRFAAWLFQIAENLHRDEVRRRHAEKRTGTEVSLDKMMLADEEPSLPADTVDLRKKILKKELKMALREEIRKLPPRTQACLVLHVYYGLKVAEVGSAMNISTQTVKAFLFQARKRLRESLGSHFAGPGFLDEES